MQTLKTAVVVVLLLFVLYGGFVAINGSNNSLSPELEGLVDLNVNTPDISGGAVTFTPAPAGADGGTDPWATFNSAPSSPFNNAFSSPSADTSIPPSLSQNGASPAMLPPASGPALASVSDSPGLPDLPPLPPLPSLSGESKGTAGASPAGLLASNNRDEKPADSSGVPSAPDFGIAIPNAKNLPSDAGAEGGAAENGSAPKDLDGTGDTPLADNAAKAPSAGKSYENAKETALAQAAKGSLKEALATLSLFYNANELTAEQREDLLDILDALAREVVYSRQHFLDIAYYPAPGETIDQVAAKFEIPVDILARINAMKPGAPVPTGSSVKVVPGPFRAELDLKRHELTLFLGELYAGRYPVSVGKDLPESSGDFKVVDKQKDRNYYGDGAPIAGTDPKNPYGGFWIDLGSDLCIHGSSAEANDELGCVSLSPQDASDVFGMLAHGSQVTVIR